MAKFTVEINDAEEKAMLTDMISIQDWLDNAIHNKARRTIDAIIEQKTDKQFKKISVEEKHHLIMKMKLETAAEKDEKVLELLKGE